MKRFIPVIILLIAIAGAIWYGHRPAVNPDPNHNHADFAVWINGTKLDFSAEKYMTEELTPEELAVLETQTATGSKMQVLKQYLHLHDGNGHVIHRHKPGLTFGDFFDTVGFMITPNAETAGVDPCVSFEGKNYCDSADAHWHFYINGKPGVDTTNWKGSDLLMAKNYAFRDDDKLLLVYGDDPVMIQRGLADMTDDACLYSKTCPWRGPAPTENCIADPTVPCVEVHP